MAGGIFVASWTGSSWSLGKATDGSNEALGQFQIYARLNEL